MDKIAKQTHTGYMGNVYGFTENSNLWIWPPNTYKNLFHFCNITLKYSSYCQLLRDKILFSSRILSFENDNKK